MTKDIEHFENKPKAIIQRQKRLEEVYQNQNIPNKNYINKIESNFFINNNNDDLEG